MADLSVTALVPSPVAGIASAQDIRVEQCDGCGAQAYVQVVLESGSDLFLCGHHALQYQRALIASGAGIRRCRRADASSPSRPPRRTSPGRLPRAEAVTSTSVICVPGVTRRPSSVSRASARRELREPSVSVKATSSRLWARRLTWYDMTPTASGTCSSGAGTVSESAGSTSPPTGRNQGWGTWDPQGLGRRARAVTFTSGAADLVAGDANGANDRFLWSR